MTDQTLFILIGAAVAIGAGVRHGALRWWPAWAIAAACAVAAIEALLATGRRYAEPHNVALAAGAMLLASLLLNFLAGAIGAAIARRVSASPKDGAGGSSPRSRP